MKPHSLHKRGFLFARQPAAMLLCAAFSAIVPIPLADKPKKIPLRGLHDP